MKLFRSYTLAPEAETTSPSRFIATSLPNWRHKSPPLGILLGFALFVLLLFGLLNKNGPLSSIIEIGLDERFEVTKSLLWSNGYVLYERIWDNQPPLFTALLGTAFKCFGSTIGTARAVAVCFGLSLMAALFTLIKKRSGLWAGVIAVFFLVCSPQILGLFVSPMLEVPAIGTGLWALSILCCSPTKHRRLHLVLSGVLLGLSSQMKLTVAVLIPAMVVELFIKAFQINRTGRIHQSVSDSILWGGSAVGTFFITSYLLGGSYDQMWKSLLYVRPEYVNEVNGLTFPIASLLHHPEGIAGASAGLILALLRRNFRNIRIPTVLLLTAFVVHLNHHPWWSYYYLHLAIPFAWLTGYAIVTLLQSAFRKPIIISNLSRTTHDFAFRALLVAFVLCVVFDGESRLVSESTRILQLPRMQDSPILAKMRSHRKETKWVFSDRQSILPFHANLLLIPELAVLPRNRFWSGSVNQENILTFFKRYRPEQVLLTSGDSSGVEDFVWEHYALVCEDGNKRLYFLRNGELRTP